MSGVFEPVTPTDPVPSRSSRSLAKASGQAFGVAGFCAVMLAGAFLLTFRLTEFPPGLHVDAAVEGFNVLSVLQGHLAVFFPINMGHGAAYVYFEAAMMALAGTHRLTYGFAGFAIAMLGIALTIRFFKLLFGLPVALLSGALMATSLWVIFISRIGVWQTTMPAATVAPLYFLWRTYKFGRRRDAVLGGLALGLSQYAYYAIRFLPLLVLFLFAADLVRSGRRVGRLMQFVFVSLLVFLPEGIYFARHPDVVVSRPEQVTIFSPNVAQTASNIVAGVRSTAGMFFVLGDYRPWQSIPYHPVFDPLLAGLFCLGLLLALLRWRDVRCRWILLWLFVMLLPTVLTSDPPSNFRAYGAAPVTFVFPALAMVWLWERLRWPSIGIILAALLMVVEGYLSFDLYFQKWGKTDQASIAFDAQDTAMAQFAEDHPGALIYFSDIRTLSGQPVRALVTATDQQSWYPEDSAIIPIPAKGTGDVYYVGSPRSAIGSLAPAWLPQVQQLATTNSSDPRGMWAYRWPSAGRDQLLAGQQPLGVSFGNDLAIRSYSVQKREGMVDIVILWEQLHPSGPYDLYTHVLAASGKQVGQNDKLYFPVEILGLKERLGEGTPSGDLILTQYSYPLTPGHYNVEIGAVHRSESNVDALLLPAGPAGHFQMDVT